MTTSKKGRTRLYVAAGSLLGVAALVTTAAFTDFANLNLGNGSDDSGIGGNNRFNIQVVGTDEAGNPVPGTWQEAASPEGVDINVPGADLLTPGDTVTVDIPFQNESPKLGADLSFGLQDRAGKTSDPELAGLLDYTVALDGTPIVSDASQAEVTGLDLGVYAAGDGGTLTVTVSLPDQGSPEANNALQGKTVFVQAHFDATSTQ